MPDPAPPEHTRSTSPRLTRWALLGVVLLAFVMSVDLLQLAANHLQPHLESTLPFVIAGDLSALGTSWLSAYIMVSGSVVAAVALAFYESTLISASELTMMLFGSRFGAAGIVLLVGLADALNNRTVGLRQGTSMGILTFLATFATGLPAALIAWIWSTTGLHLTDDGLRPILNPPATGPIASLSEQIVALIGPTPALALAIGLLLGALKLFDHTLKRFDLSSLTHRASQLLDNRWSATLIGLGLTLLTTSVAFSVASLVPLYNRGALRPHHALPYLLGANIGTLGDTALIALLLDHPGGVELVGVMVTSLVLITLASLASYPLFSRAVFSLSDWIGRTRKTTLLSLAGLVLAPLLMTATALL